VLIQFFSDQHNDNTQNTSLFPPLYWAVFPLLPSQKSQQHQFYQLVFNLVLTFSQYLDQQLEKLLKNTSDRSKQQKNFSGFCWLIHQ